MLPRDHLPNGAGAGWVKWIFFTMGHRGHIPTYKGSDHFSLQLQHQLWAQNWDNTVIYGLVLVYPKSPRPVDFASKSSISSRTSMMVVDHEKSGVSPWEKHEKHWFTQEKKIGKSKMFETKNCKKTTKTTISTILKLIPLLFKITCKWPMGCSLWQSHFSMKNWSLCPQKAGLPRIASGEPVSLWNGFHLAMGHPEIFVINDFMENWPPFYSPQKWWV